MEGACYPSNDGKQGPRRARLALTEKFVDTILVADDVKVEGSRGKM